MIIIYLALVVTAIYWVIKLIGPEMAKPATNPSKKYDSFNLSVSDEPSVPKIQKLESLLAEKNKNIQLLQTELKIFLVQVREFDKVKTLMEDEIQRLREQNRVFRSELGLPTTQVKEHSTT